MKPLLGSQLIGVVNEERISAELNQPNPGSQNGVISSVWGLSPGENVDTNYEDSKHSIRDKGHPITKLVKQGGGNSCRRETEVAERERREGLQQTIVLP